MSNSVTIERALTGWVARLLGLTVDADVFRGGLRPEIAEGVGVLLESEIAPSAAGRPNEYGVSIMIRYYQRDRVLASLDALAAVLPRHGVAADGVTFAALRPHGEYLTWPDTFDGRETTCGTVNLSVFVNAIDD